jgi:hypothetical protein
VVQACLLLGTCQCTAIDKPAVIVQMAVQIQGLTCTQVTILDMMHMDIKIMHLVGLLSAALIGTSMASIRHTPCPLLLPLVLAGVTPVLAVGAQWTHPTDIIRGDAQHPLFLSVAQSLSSTLPAVDISQCRLSSRPLFHSVHTCPAGRQCLVF